MARQRLRKNVLVVPAIALAIAGSQVARSADFAWEANAGLGYSDNIARSSGNKQSSTMGSLGMRFSLAEESRRLQSTLSGDLEWLHYSEDAYDSEVVGNASGRARVGLVEERLHWTVEDNFGQVRRELFSAPSPDNREHVNYFATGPDLKLPLGNTMNLQLGGRYTRVDYQDSNADSQRYGGNLAIERELSQVTQLSLNGAYQRIEPRGGGPVSSYDRTSAYLRYSTEGARSTLAFDAGANRVKGDDFKSNGGLLRLELTRRLGAFSQVRARLGNELTDSGSAFGQAIDFQAPGTIPGSDALVQDAAPFTSRYVEVGWNANGRRTSVGLSAAWYDENYEEDGGALDRQRYVVGVLASRVVGPRTTISAGTQYIEYTFESPLAADNEELAFTLSGSWRAGQRVRIELAGEHRKFSADASDSSKENRVWARVHYGRQVDPR